VASTEVFDIHSHIGFYGGKEYTAEQALGRMDKNGIRRAVVCSFVSGLVHREDFREGNDYVIRAVRTHPDRFVGICALTPVHGSFALEEFRRCLDQGLSGIKLHPDKHGLYSLAGAPMTQLMHALENVRGFVFIHSDFNSKVCSPHEIVGMAQRFPQAKVLLGHFGLDQDLVGQVPRIVKPATNVYLETSQTVDHPEAVYVNSTKRIGPERVLFGSDAPIISPEVNLRKLEVAEELFGLEPKVSQAIRWDNAVRLLAGVPNVQL
jgi:uncharacterized protein